MRPCASWAPIRTFVVSLLGSTNSIKRNPLKLGEDIKKLEDALNSIPEVSDEAVNY